MTKKPTTRTNPPDRDGDGAPGGSLPGNETVDAAKGPAPETAPADAEAAPETAPAEAAPEPETAGERDVATDETAPAEDAIDADTAGAIEGRVRAPSDDHVHEPALTDPTAAAIETFTGDGGDTFTAEEIAAGQTPVVEQEGEAVVTAAEAAEAGQAELATVEPEGPADLPVAVRLDELSRLVDNRWLYKSKDGYSPSYSAPYVSQETIDVWLANGLAEARPSAGREGGVFVTDKARRAVTRGAW